MSALAHEERTVDDHRAAGRRGQARGEGHGARTLPAPGVPLAVTQLQYIQRTVGNQAAQRLVGRRSVDSRQHSRPGPAVVQRQPDDAGPDPATRGTGDISVHVGRTMTAEAALREIYDQAAGRITDEAIAMMNGGSSPDEAARWANRARNELKVRIRARGSDVTRALAEGRNVRKYGNKIGPSFDDLIRQGKTPEDIIGSAGRSNTRMTRATTRLRLAGRLLIVIDIAIVTWEVVEAPENERLRTAVEGAGGVAGAAGGGWAGAKGGAAVGTMIAPGVGTVIGGVIGGIGGALLGGWLGREAASEGYELVKELTTPNLDGWLRDIDRAEDARLKAAAREHAADLAEIESRTTGQPGRREYHPPGASGRIPEY